MLNTRQRTLLLESLRPPVGYRLDQAAGTSYTLDLMALLTAPLAFTFFNYHDEQGEPSADPVALLEALRRHSESISLFCQAGNISVPKPQQILLAYLEDSVIAVQPPKKAGIFHPKVWLLRFVAHEQPVRYRLLCLTRNLTFDRAWDTSLALEGQLTGRSRGFSKNRPLADFIEALPAMAVRPVSPLVQARVDQFASEVRRVRFEPPAPFQDFRFVPMGLGRKSQAPFPADSRLLVMAPFLSASILEELGKRHELAAVISRPEALAPLPADLLPEGNTFVLSAAAELDAREGEESDDPREEVNAGESRTELHGLHAKLYVADRGHRAHVFTGSANATAAAFQSNVEFLVELVGGRWKCGIGALLGTEEDQQQDTLRSLLQPYEPIADTEPEDEIQKALDRRVARFAREIASRNLTARVTSGIEEDTWDLSLSGRLPSAPRQTRLQAWPVTLPATAQQEVGSDTKLIAHFESVTFEAITAFWAFEIEARQEKRVAQHRFVMTAKLVGAPANRRERLLRSMLKNRRQVLRLLLLLLSDEALDVSKLVDDGETGGERWTGRFGGWDEPALLEALLQSLGRNPDRVDQAARLIEDLRRTPEGKDLLPEGLEAIWEPVWSARQEKKA